MLQRTREFCIRFALGARNADVVRPVVRKGAALALTGILIGAVLAEIVADDPLIPVRCWSRQGLITSILISPAITARGRTPMLSRTTFLSSSGAGRGALGVVYRPVSCSTAPVLPVRRCYRSPS